METEADVFEGDSGSYIIDGIGSVDPQGRFNPDRFAAKTATPASDAVEAWRELDRLLGENGKTERRFLREKFLFVLTSVRCLQNII